MERKWKPRGKIFKEALDYMKGRRTGEITSLKTRWNSFNAACLDGIEWQSLVILGGRSGSLKSAIKDQIIRDAFEYNPKETFRVLDFQFEMIGRVTALREFSAHAQKSYKHLCSADGEITRETYLSCKAYGKEKGDGDNFPVDVIEDSCTIKEFGQHIDNYMEAHKDEKGDYTKTLITVDHSVLFLISDNESGLNDTLSNLGRMLTAKKRKYPIIFIVLSQLNRNIEQSGRNEEKKFGNYVLASDIYHSDALLFHADIVIGLDRPYLRDLRVYGPPGFILDSERDLVMRFIKARNGEGQLSFFDADGSTMTITEKDPPPTIRVMSKQTKK